MSINSHILLVGQDVLDSEIFGRPLSPFKLSCPYGVTDQVYEQYASNFLG